MCLLLFSYQPEKNGLLVVVANRDEFYDRPSEQAHIWSRESGDEASAGQILAGRDLKSKGTWFGINSERNRFAAVTNYRQTDWKMENTAIKSRGDLPVEFLTSNLDSMTFLGSVQENRTSYNGFNLLVFDGGTLAWYTNRSAEGPKKVDGGMHGLCNGLLDAAWPKVERGKLMLERRLEEDSCIDKHPDESMLDLLLDGTVPADEELPDTGVGVEMERLLAPVFVSIEGVYGTRCSTLLVMDASGPISFVEKTHVPADLAPDTVAFDFRRNGPTGSRAKPGS